VNPYRFLIVAGEASGDMYGAEVARSLFRRFPGCEIYGMGGQRMRDAGVQLEGDISRTAVIGPFEVISSLGKLYRVFRRLADRIEKTPISAAILIDFPDFNLRLAKRVKSAGIPVIYYVSPQVWAWREGRVKQMKQVVDKMLVIFPFEEEFYRKAGIDAAFVGHPLMNMARAAKSKQEFCETANLDPRKPIVALLPGSRRKEIRYILPPLCEAAALIRQQKPDAQFVLPMASGIDRAFLENLIQSQPITIVANETYNAVRYARAAIVASGTATLETALLGTPEVVVYKISGASWYVGKMLLKVRFYGIVNIILGEEVVPELFQDRMTPESVAQTTLRLMDDVWLQSRIRGNYEKLRRMLGSGDTAERVVDEIAKRV
jgi:lipid-A-disaccharide synthase